MEEFFHAEVLLFRSVLRSTDRWRCDRPDHGESAINRDIAGNSGHRKSGKHPDIAYNNARNANFTGNESTAWHHTFPDNDYNPKSNSDHDSQSEHHDNAQSNYDDNSESDHHAGPERFFWRDAAANAQSRHEFNFTHRQHHRWTVRNTGRRSRNSGRRISCSRGIVHNAGRRSWFSRYNRDNIRASDNGSATVFGAYQRYNAHANAYTAVDVCPLNL